ncbi:SGNH/GDSL hydrolase family protein [Subtercola endophyticus]|uniref:SGNH/GDSL hydrolase family protein n=1 Tax=Subtercola endophyticus TaxID=2895559 RepID=UPI001E50E223|nr:SGNH/GDSL hydrolase family protein [Subtercola endophyticus]UFS59821.1 SGNH/GDSL hydrolase family protein [Subtercola endophyticus]
MRRRTAGISSAIVIAAVLALADNAGASAQAGPVYPFAAATATTTTATSVASTPGTATPSTATPSTAAPSAPSTAAAPAPSTPGTAFTPQLGTPAPTGTASAEASQRPVVAAIGDSIMDGHNVGADQAWPVLVSEANDWQLTNLSIDGTGFVQLGNDGNTFESQVVEAGEMDATVVIISASSNDLGQDPDTLAQATLATMASLRAQLPNAQIVALSAFWGDTAPPPQLTDIDNDLQNAAAATGATYIDIGQPLAGEPDLMQSDDVHPTAQGLVHLAAAIDADITQQRVVG